MSPVLASTTPSSAVSSSASLSSLSSPATISQPASSSQTLSTLTSLRGVGLVSTYVGVSASRPPRGEVFNTAGLTHAQCVALRQLLNPSINTGNLELTLDFNISPPPEGSSVWKPQYKDLSGKHLTMGHIGRENSLVAALVENNSILPGDVEFYEKQTFSLLALMSAQARYNVNVVDHSLCNQLLRYEEYITNICQSLGISREDSIIDRLDQMKTSCEKTKEASTKIAELQSALEKAKDASTKVVELQKALDRAKDENQVSQASIEKVKADKDLAVNELVNVKLELAKEKSLREKVDATFVK